MAALSTFRVLDYARRQKVPGLTLDFSAVTRAYPEGMMRLIGRVEHLRRGGMHFDLVLPDDRKLARIFAGSNWAHYLAPVQFDPSSSHGQSHLPARRYHDASGQRRFVDDTLELVLHQIEIERPLLHALEWSLNEITDNVLVHANAPDGGLAQVAVFHEQRRIQFVVIDGGRGIRASMREAYPELRRHTDAIGEAMKKGVTRSKDIGQGNGLAGALRIATGAGGSFNVLSHRGEVLVTPTHQGASDHRQIAEGRDSDESFPGTLVFVELLVDRLVDLDKALDFGGGGAVEWDYIDSAYGDDETQAIQLRVAQEAVGFGSREAGRAFRTKVENLLRAAPGRALCLDWTGVPLPSSSFVDEVVGRLFLSLGPVQFIQRVRLVGVEPLVRGLLDQAVMQRVQDAVD